METSFANGGQVSAGHAEPWARPAGIPKLLRWLGREDALRHSEGGVAGGVYTPQDESGDAHRFTQGLARSCAERGVAFRYGTVVEAIEREADAIRLQGGERLLADAYVVALGSYSPLLLRGLGLKIPVYPLKGYSITLPLGAAEPMTAPEVSLTDEAHKIVISRLGDRLRAAGTAELAGYDASVNPVRCNAIVRRIRQLFPGLGGITVVERWAGLRPATPSNVPIIGRTRLRKLFLNTGHGTLGWTLASGSANALADLVSRRQPEVAFDFLAEERIAVAGHPRPS